MKKVLARALTERRILILDEVCNNTQLTSTALLSKISAEKGIPLSTLKSNAKILRDLDLITENSPLELTKSGEIILDILRR